MRRKSSAFHDMAAPFGSREAGRVGILTDYTGTPRDDRYDGTAQDDYFDMSQGGIDRVNGLGGDDTVQMGGLLDGRDRLNGGTGYDTLLLNGDYSSGLRLTNTVLAGFEQINLAGGFRYKLTLDGSIVPAGGLFSIFGAGTSAGIKLDGAAVGNSDLVLVGGSGDDTLFGGAGNDYLRANGGIDTIDGGGGYNRISFGNADRGVTLDLNIARQQDTGVGRLTLRNVNDVSGSSFGDTLTGNEADNYFVGNGGADHFSGRGGNDLFEMGPDLSGTLPTGVVVYGGDGSDTISFNDNGGATAGIALSLGEVGDQVTGQGSYTIAEIENASGTFFNDMLKGTAAANILYGDGADDKLTGGGGDDTLYGDKLPFPFDGNGTDGPVTLFDADNPGDDKLIGGAGADIMTGGLGDDLFVFQKLSDSRNAAPDIVTDFGAGSDRIDLREIDANSRISNDQPFHFGVTPGHTGDIAISYDAGADRTIVALFVDPDNAADATILLAGNHLDLTASDFIL